MTPTDLKRLGYELSGVIADVEQGEGFDQICLDTLKRVETQLFAWATESIPLKHSEHWIEP